jgi:hypothetical protein
LEIKIGGSLQIHLLLVPVIQMFSKQLVFAVMYLLLYRLLKQILLFPLCLMKHHFIKTYWGKGEVAPLHTEDED